jgi:hypothetical protein
MSTAIPPYPYFNGITYNPSLFSSSTDYITATTGKKLFLSYPTSQGEETFASNVSLKSSLTDITGSKGLSGQVLSSTVSGTQWIYSGSSGYIAYNLSSLPFTLPTTSYSNLYILFTGTVGSGGIMTIPITGFTAGTLINIKNASTGTVNISTTSMQYTATTSSTTIFGIGGGDVFQFYFNGSFWIQNTLGSKIMYLTVTNTLTLTGGFATETMTQIGTHGISDEINLYSTTIYGDIFLGRILPAPYNVRLANTSSGGSGALVHCSNISIDDNKINNSSVPTTGLIKLANAQTTGQLYLGCGSTTAARTTGPIFIGSDSTASGGINIGTGTDLTVPSVNTVNIGSGTYGTVIKGALTTSTAITLPTTPPTLTTSNLGYSYNFSSISVSSNAIATSFLYSPATNSAGGGNYLNAGIYAVYVNTQVYESNAPTAGAATYTLGVCYGSTTGTLSTIGPQYGTITSVSKQSTYVRTGNGNLRIGTALAGTFTLTSANFVNIQVIINVTSTFTSGNFWVILDGLIVRIG